MTEPTGPVETVGAGQRGFRRHRRPGGRARKRGGGEGFVIGFAVTSPGNWYQWSVGGWQNRWTRLQRVDDGVRHDLNDPVAVPVETGR